MSDDTEIQFTRLTGHLPPKTKEAETPPQDLALQALGIAFGWKRPVHQTDFQDRFIPLVNALLDAVGAPPLKLTHDQINTLAAALGLDSR